jgi:hypothetical protein
MTEAIHGTRDDLMWLCGIIEGEGCVDLHRGKYPRIRIAMTDRDVIGRAASLMDAKIRLSLHAAPAKPTWHTEISGERATGILREILPYMGARRSQRIATVLAAVSLNGASSAPGPRVTRPAGITKPVTAS